MISLKKSSLSRVALSHSIRTSGRLESHRSLPRSAMREASNRSPCSFQLFLRKEGYDHGEHYALALPPPRRPSHSTVHSSSTAKTIRRRHGQNGRADLLADAGPHLTRYGALLLSGQPEEHYEHLVERGGKGEEGMPERTPGAISGSARGGRCGTACGKLAPNEAAALICCCGMVRMTE